VASGDDLSFDLSDVAGASDFVSKREVLVPESVTRFSYKIENVMEGK